MRRSIMSYIQHCEGDDCIRILGVQSITEELSLKDLRRFVTDVPRNWQNGSLMLFSYSFIFHQASFKKPNRILPH